MTEVVLKVEAVRIEGRHRKDLGDIEALARSIERDGLINAITVTLDNRLLAGERRLAAYRLLGRDKIEARVVDTLDDAVARLRIERDENTERKRMLPSELVALGRELERLESPKSLERKREAGRKGAAIRLGRPLVPGLSSAEDNPGTTESAVASALGTSQGNYYRAKKVVEAASDPDRSEDQREIARQALADMDSGATSVAAAYKRVKVNAPVRTGAPQSTTIAVARVQRRSISSAEAALSGICHGLSQIEELHQEITSEEAARWADSLWESRRTITSLIKLLRERTNAQQS